jgi:hypothetical protein
MLLRERTHQAALNQIVGTINISRQHPGVALQIRE